MNFETTEDVEDALDRWLREVPSRKCVTTWTLLGGHSAVLTSRSERTVEGTSKMSSNDAIADALKKWKQGEHDGD